MKKDTKTPVIPVEIKAAGRTWHIASVLSYTEEQFIKDPAHTIEGYTERPDENTTILKGVYKQCKEATAGKIEPAPVEELPKGDKPGGAKK